MPSAALSQFHAASSSIAENQGFEYQRDYRFFKRAARELSRFVEHSLSRRVVFAEASLMSTISDDGERRGTQAVAKIGFVLITHREPNQIVRLVRRLNELFFNPPIVCHHDFSRCDLPAELVPSNVAFVRPHVATQWADFSLVDATIRAIRQLYENSPGRDWFVLLSGSDYPIKPASWILHDLESGSFDAHIHHERIQPARFQHEWQRSCFERYFRCRIKVPSVTRHLRLRWGKLRVPQFLAGACGMPFSSRFCCFAGSQWFSANRRAAHAIINETATHRKLAAHGRRDMLFDETYFHSILGNTAGLRLNNRNYRYADWSAGGPHPKTLDMIDLPQLLSSSDHFARKFAGRAEIFDAIDDAVDAMERSTRRSAAA